MVDETKGGSAPFCLFEWTENNERKTRRVMSLRVQDRRGTTFQLTGDRLPVFMSLETGHSASAKGIAEILFSERPVVSLVEAKQWPAPRDLLNVVIGFVLTLGVRLLASVVEAAQ